jgi:hypothetical protein
MKSRCFLISGLVLQAAACSSPGDGRAPEPGRELESRAESIRPRPEELGWRGIPWLRDLTEAQEAARRERRPIFLFVSAYDPLGRC